MTLETKTVWKRLIEIVENSTDFPDGITNRKFATAGLPMGNTKQKNGLGNDAYLNKWQWCNLNINYTRNSISIPMLIGSVFPVISVKLTVWIYGNERHRSLDFMRSGIISQGQHSLNQSTFNVHPPEYQWYRFQFKTTKIEIGIKNEINEHS